MALTYLNAQMIEQPADFIQLSAQNFQANTISTTNLLVSSVNGDTTINGNVTINGVLTALSGFNVVFATTTTTSALSVSNLQASPALDVYQGPAYPVIAVFKNSTGNITTIKDTGLTVTGIISSNDVVYSASGNSNLWNEIYTNVQTNSADWVTAYTSISVLSASWEESADILPTVTNYLSTSNVSISSLTVFGDISATGTVSVSGLNIVSGNVFAKSTFNNLVSALEININGSTLYMPLLSAI